MHKKKEGVGMLNVTGSTIKEFLANQDSPNTKLVYGTEIRLFLRTIGKKNIRSIRTEDVMSYKQKICHLQPATIARKLITLSRFFEYAFSQGYIQKNITKQLKVPKVNQKTPEVLNLQQSGALLRAPDRRSLIGKRDFAILSLMLSTGMRLAETMKTDVGDFGTKYNKTVLKVKGKGRKERIVRIPVEVEEAIKDYRKSLNHQDSDGEALFLTTSKRNRKPARITGICIRHMINKYRQKALIDKKISPHSLRHTCFSLELENGASVKELQEQAGHVSLSSTQRYLHILDHVNKNAVDKHPLFNRKKVIS